MFQKIEKLYCKKFKNYVAKKNEKNYSARN